MKQIMGRNERGFTFVELLLALTILSLALSAIMSVFSNIGRAGADSYHYHTALALAQSKMEEIKSHPFTEAVDIPSADFAEKDGYSELAGFQYAVTIMEDDLLYKSFIVTVFYGAQDQLKEVSLWGEISRR